MRLILLAVLVLTVSGFSSCDWPWDNDKEVNGTASEAASK